MCEKCGTRCVVCGHAPGEPLSKPPAPPESDPVGPDREFCCRYCPHVAPSTRSLEEHQEARHPGVGVRLVSDVREWWWEAG